MYQYKVVLYDAPLQDPIFMVERVVEDYEDAVTEAAEMTEGNNIYRAEITITRKEVEHD